MSRNLEKWSNKQCFSCRSWFLCALIALCSLVSSVHALETDSLAAAKQLYKSSGLQELVVQVPTSTASSFEAALTVDRLPQRFSGIAHDSIKSAIRKAFTTDTFDKHLTRELARKMSQESIQAMLTWYESPLGSRVKQAEIDNSLLTEESRFDAFVQKLSNSGVDSQRELMIFRLDEAMQSTDSAVDMMISIQVAFNVSLSRFLPESERLSSSDIQTLAKQNYAGMRTQYRNQTREVLLFTYQDFNNDELEQFHDALESVAGQEFVVAINEGLKNGMFAASLDLGDELGVLIGDEQDGPGI